MAMIENDPTNNLFATAEEIKSFFVRLDRPSQVKLIFDVQNLWSMGVFPTMEVYRSPLKMFIGYLHVKGGIKHARSSELQWKSSLGRCPWPVAEMVKRAVADGISPVICLDLPRCAKPGYEYENIVERDLHYLRTVLS